MAWEDMTKLGFVSETVNSEHILKWVTVNYDLLGISETGFDGLKNSQNESEPADI